MSLRIAYFVNQYPKVSHTFIRREIAALERQGLIIERMALRGWDADVADVEDEVERAKTRYVLQGGAGRLLLDAFFDLVMSPMAAIRALLLSWKMSRRSGRHWPIHVFYIAEAFRVLRWLRSSGAQHVHAHFGTNSAEVVMLARVLGGPSYSFTVHGPEEFDKPEALGLGQKAANAAFVVAISSFGRSQLFRWMPAEQWSKIHVVHCGLENAFFAEQGLRADSPPARLVCVGRICEQKGQLLLVEAAALLSRQGVHFELVLAGDGEMRKAVQDAAVRCDIESRVRITGWISSEQVRVELIASRALVLPSFAEGLPVVIMEAMAQARPVITTYIAGIPELVRDMIDGWLVPAGDVERLAAAMRDCLGSSAEELGAMGRAAHSRVMALHHVDTEAARLIGLFRSATGVPG